MGPWPCETISFVYPLVVKFSNKKTDCFSRKRYKKKVFLSSTVLILDCPYLLICEVTLYKERSNVKRRFIINVFLKTCLYFYQFIIIKQNMEWFIDGNIAVSFIFIGCGYAANEGMHEYVFNHEIPRNKVQHFLWFCPD